MLSRCFDRDKPEFYQFTHKVNVNLAASNSWDQSTLLTELNIYKETNSVGLMLIRNALKKFYIFFDICLDTAQTCYFAELENEAIKREYSNARIQLFN
jgi:hypothetical protein